MHSLRASLFAVLWAGLAISQPRPDSTPVEAAVNSLFDAIHRGDADAAQQLYSADGKFYLPAGAENPITRSGPRFIVGLSRNCALYVRHVQMLTPDAAYVVALRRCPEPPQDSGFGRRPAGDSGTLDLTLRHEEAGWRLTSWREASLEGVAAVKQETVADSAGPEMLTAKERAEGWTSLFDGRSFRGWMNPSGEEAPPSSWRIVDGALATVPRTAGAPIISLRTRQEFINFDFMFEWKVQENANSGCIYRLFTARDGMEYQIADDNGDPGARVDPRQRAGALYGVTPVEKSAARPVGEWNEAHIRVTRERIEHWLNGTKTAEYPVDVPLPSPIVLQYHFTEVKFRNLKIRRLP
jgi:hypothetical protein